MAEAFGLEELGAVGSSKAADADANHELEPQAFAKDDQRLPLRKRWWAPPLVSKS